MNWIHQDSVLCLNANYLRIGWKSPAEAFCMLMGESSKSDSPVALALDIVYDYDEYGKPITDKMVTFDRLEWEDWLTVEPRRGDLDKCIHTSKRIIRCPTVIVCGNYNLMPMRHQKPTLQAIRRRDQDTCQYSGKKLTRQEISLDHIKPRHMGGRDTFENLVLCHKEINYKKGGKTLEESGLRLLKKPQSLKPIPLCSLLVDNRHVDHQWF